MPIIDEILKLPKEQQIEIMKAIQDHMEDMPWEKEELSASQIDFIKTRVQQINSAPHKTYSWAEVKEKLANRWNTL